MIILMRFFCIKSDSWGCSQTRCGRSCILSPEAAFCHPQREQAVVDPLLVILEASGIGSRVSSPFLTLDFFLGIWLIFSWKKHNETTQKSSV